MSDTTAKTFTLPLRLPCDPYAGEPAEALTPGEPLRLSDEARAALPSLPPASPADAIVLGVSPPEPTTPPAAGEEA